ncbi:MAG: TSUP family transporter [Dermatophilaceae bacterium]
MLAVGCIVLLASAGQTVTGFGFALLAAPLLAVVVGSHESVAAVTVISLPVTSLIALRHRRVVDIGTASRLVAAGAAGAPAGVWLLSILGGRVLQGLVGVTVPGTGYLCRARRLHAPEARRCRAAAQRRRVPNWAPVSGPRC